MPTTPPAGPPSMAAAVPAVWVPCPWSSSPVPFVPVKSMISTTFRSGWSLSTPVSSPKNSALIPQVAGSLPRTPSQVSLNFAWVAVIP